MKKYRVVLISCLLVVLMVSVSWASWVWFWEHYLEDPGESLIDDFPLTANIHYRAMIDVVHTDYNGKAQCQIWGSGGLLHEFTIKESSVASEGYYQFTVPTSDTYYLFSKNISSNDEQVMVYWRYEE